MLETTNVISYKPRDPDEPYNGLYVMAEAFVYSSTKRDIKLIVIKSDGFKEGVIRENITNDFLVYLYDMFGYDEFYLLFEGDGTTYLLERRQSQLIVSDSQDTLRILADLDDYLNDGKTKSKKNKGS